jgi:hypothetical protein
LYSAQSLAADNEADKSFIPSKATATSVTSAQQKFEAKKTADVAKRNAANGAETQALKDKVGTLKKNRQNEFSNYYVQYVPEEDMFLSIDKFMTDDEWRAEQAH